MAGDALLEAGRVALRAGDWAAARDAFTGAAASGQSGDALDGLGMALWWLKDPAGAIEARTQAFVALRRERRLADAARVAAWLAREYRTLYRNVALADGWLARARTTAEGADTEVATGWVYLAEAEAAADQAAAACAAAAAIDAARRGGDADLEIVALARLGEIKVSAGEVESGVAHLDEAMAAASAGEALDPQSVGEACCALMDAAALLGDTERFARWADAVDGFRARHDYAPMAGYAPSTVQGALSAFCSACCGGIFLVTGRLDEAEAELIGAITELEVSGMHSRCIHPVTQLAELRVVQGRLEDAAALLAQYEDLPECVRPLAVLDLARGEPHAAADRLRHGIGRLRGRTVAELPLLVVLVDAEIAADNRAAAEQAAAQLNDIAEITGSARHAAEAAFARAKVEAAGDNDAAPLLREAASALGDAGLSLSACRARMAFARAVAAADRPVAIAEARGAMASFERLGATADADAAAAFLRELGVRGRTGRKDLGALSKREKEVLRLVAEGLSNAEIAARLFISVKTAGHHVSNILTKLGMRSRTEAAAYAALHPLPEPAGK